MTELSTYTGKPLNSFVRSFIQELEAEGFRVIPTDRGPSTHQRKTLQIRWQGVYIGQMKADLWGAKKPFACLYRFATEDVMTTVASAPYDFDKHEFAKKHGCDPTSLHVRIDSGKPYLLVRDAATAMQLMHDWAKKIHEAQSTAV